MTMKRSTSKKNKLPKPEDGNQQKISSFFQPGTGQVQSKLFSSVAKTKPPLSFKQHASASKPGSTSTTAKSVQKSHSDSGKNSMTVLKNFNNATAQREALRQSECVESSEPGSPEIVIIPDTPEGKRQKPRLKLASRSFLCPVSQLSTMPGKRPSPPKTKQRKVVKKSLGPVSVEFGQKRLSNDGKAELKMKENSAVMGDATLGCTETKTEGNCVVVSDTTSDHSEGVNMLVTSCPNPDCGTDVVSVEEDIDSADVDMESGTASSVGGPAKSETLSSSVDSAKPHGNQRESHTVKDLCVQSVTPTKVSCDRSSIKRMAVPGLSPDSKRLQGTETMVTDDSESSETTTSQRKVKAKRQLASLAGFKDVRDMNQRVNKYQLGGRAKDSSDMDVSSTQDHVLADILGQMSSTASPALSENKKHHSTHKQKQSSPVMADNRFREQLMDMKSPIITSEDTTSRIDTTEDDVLTEILGELGNTLCPNNNTHRKSHTPNLFRNDKDRSGEESRKSYVPQLKIDDDNISTSTHTVDQDAKTENKLSTKHGLHLHSGYIASNVKGHGPSLHIGRSISTDVKGATSVGGGWHCESAPSNTRRDHVAVQLENPRIPSPHRRQHLTVELEDPVGRELAGSFQQLSPFKSRVSQTRSASKPPQPTEPVMKFTDKWNRFIVRSATIDRECHDKILTLSKEGSSEVIRTARLRGFWADTHVEAGDVVHLLPEDEQQTSGIGGSHGNGDCPITIDDGQGQIVVNPDLLLSGTTIVSGVYCLRRSVLNEKFKGVDSKNAHMLYGSIIHSLFQQVLKDRLTKTEEIWAEAKSIVQSNKFLHDMYGQNVSEERVMEEVEQYVGPLQSWLYKHVPSIAANSNTDHRCGDGASDVSVVQIHDIEETIWSPRIGVKGKIDMTVEVEMRDQGTVKRKVVPLELKTGKASYSVEHKGQVTLYSMMMCDRRENPEQGLLLYLKHNDMNTIPVRPQNTRGLLQLRNEMAYYLRGRVGRETGGESKVCGGVGRLPGPINSHRACSKCPQLLNCAVYQRSVEDTQYGADHAMNSLVPETLSHLSDSHLSYFRHWLQCMELETRCQHREGLHNIWCMSSSDREEKGDCLQQLVMVNSTLGVPETQAFMEGKGCCVQFQRKPGFMGGALNTAGLTKNDAVVISSEDGRYIALSTGFIKNVTEDVVDVVVDRDSFHDNTAFQSLVFRVDRCDVFNTAGYLMTNLSRLLDPSPHCQKLRSLIIDGSKPEFQMTMSKTAVEKVKKIFRPLNKPQKTAILKVLMCKDYVLIKGYPGTGKTSTIVALVKILRELGLSVLLTSYTHSAVDNILMKLKQDGVNFLRLGRSSRVHPLIQGHTAETLTLDITSVDELREFYNSYDVVATSCLGINHPVFTQRRFDVCIVDEASQVLQPACLGPLFYADKFVLVGDPQQLPPVVQSKEASSLGMGESLFARLDGAGATYDLHLQYRMNSTIMQLSNELVYKGALTCGSDPVSMACLQPLLPSVAGDVAWLKRALDTSLPNAVVFLDTCQMAAPESCDGRGLINETEVNLIHCLCSTFIQAGVLGDDIGVIAPYRAQVRALQQRLSGYFPLKGVEVNTVDQYQGRDKSVIFISYVRSATPVDSDSRGGLLQDVRRLNVAVTRAKHKLVLVGNSATLTQYRPVDTLLNNLRSRQQIFVLPADLHLQTEMDI